MFRLTAVATLLLASFASQAGPFTIKTTSTIADNADTLILLVGPEQLNTNPQLAAISQQENFTAKHAKTLTWLSPAAPYAQFKRVVLMGTGEPEKLSAYQASLLGAAAARSLKDSAASNIQLDASMIDPAIGQAEFLAQFSHGVDLSSYTFDRYLSDKKTAPERNLFLLSSNKKATDERLVQLNALSEGVALARDLINEPASGIYPETFVQQALALRKLGAKVTVMDEKALEKAGMGAILAVGRGSARPPRLLLVHWEGSKQQPVAVVGKGITFDTGGYNLKTQADSIFRMTSDMAGAAAVLGTMHTLVKQQAPVNVIGVMALAENMISDRAYLPGDIVRAGNGKTIEIINTDAEGRLVLADALWHVETQYKPRAIVDIATLTGSKVTAVGNYYAGLFSNDETLVTQLTQAGEKVHERVWRLPLSDDMLPELKSMKADLRNTGRSTGASTAALFLNQFVNDTPFAHLDIAGNALSDSSKGLHTEGGTGFGVRLLTEWVLTTQ
ncbi:leucyl aminopeptidase [Arsukibacterium indicum]|uniref:Probable cytosol aminopeptidase n=1 Tax=Arsukibacterium indicum TaxID=2848612 RepID=A0ABS6MIA5_9GAMM|nr:leucyl aminopeptidase [Arsukibacterium indicum]MBV2128528.1 leucyl aminopeptidase [Arsukibacterium indicum]